RSYELDKLIEHTRDTQRVCEASWTFNSISTDPLNYLERPAYPLQGYGVPMRDGKVGVFLENKQEAVVLSEQRDRWMSDVAHELKTPLTSIRLVAETLQSRVNPQLTSWVERLLKEVIRLSKLVDDVLKISSLEQAAVQVEDETPTDLAPLINAVWQGVEPIAKLKQLTLDYQGPSQLIALINASLMHSVLFNLLSNAVKYSPAGQSICVRLSMVAQQGVAGGQGAAGGTGAKRQQTFAANTVKYILLEVIDAGKGFETKDLPHVFERFYRSDLARSRGDRLEDGGVDDLIVADLPSSGTGLGLAIVRQIVEAHQGRVKAKNDTETGGACLQVWLPGKRLVDITVTHSDAHSDFVQKPSL
ncbi:MAG: HAMP domain-containing sensor histidine kinase, partial [Cyanobacteria bacterium J06555_13]